MSLFLTAALVCVDGRATLTCVEANGYGETPTYLVWNLQDPARPQPDYHVVLPREGLAIRREQIVRTADGREAPEGGTETGNIFYFADRGRREAFLEGYGYRFLRNEDGTLRGVEVPTIERLNAELSRHGPGGLSFEAYPGDLIPHEYFLEKVVSGVVPLARNVGVEWTHDRLVHVPGYLILSRYPEILRSYRWRAMELLLAHRRAPTEATATAIREHVQLLDFDSGLLVRFLARRSADQVPRMLGALTRLFGVEAYNRNPRLHEPMLARLAREIHERFNPELPLP